MQAAGYLQLNIFSLILCILLLWHNHKSKNEVLGKKTFQYLLIEVCIVVILNSVSWILEGKGEPKTRGLYYVVLELEFIFQIIPCYMMLVYTQESGKKHAIYARIIRILPLIAGIVMMLINIGTPFVFRINQGNVYERLGGFYLVGSIPTIYLIWSLINCLISYFKNNKNSEKRTMYLQYMVMLLFSVAGVFIQIFFYGMETRWMMSILGFIYIYVNVQRTREISPGAGGNESVNYAQSDSVSFRV